MSKKAKAARPARAKRARRKAPVPETIVRQTAEPEPRGLQCPDCACRHFLVDRTKPVATGIIRYRHCRHCGRRIATFERRAGD